MKKSKQNKDIELLHRTLSIIKKEEDEHNNSFIVKLSDVLLDLFLGIGILAWVGWIGNRFCNISNDEKLYFPVSFVLFIGLTFSLILFYLGLYFNFSKDEEFEKPSSDDDLIHLSSFLTVLSGFVISFVIIYYNQNFIFKENYGKLFLLTPFLFVIITSLLDSSQKGTKKNEWMIRIGSYLLVIGVLQIIFFKLFVLTA